MRLTFRLVIVLYILTRFGFLANYPHFYDSPEYVKLAQIPHVTDALRQSHESLHPVYLWLTHYAYLIVPHPVALSAVAALFGLLSLISLYWLTHLLFDETTAAKAALVFCVLPLPWLLHTQMMHESVDQGLFLLGAASAVGFFKTKRQRYWWLSLCSLALSELNYVGMIVWFPLLLPLITWSEQKLKLNDWIQTLILIGSSLLISQILLLSIFRAAGIETGARLNYLIGKEGSQLLALFSPIGLVRALRNSLVVLWHGFSPLSLLLLGWGLLAAYYRKQWPVVLTLLSIMLGLLVSMSFWHGGLYGRLGGVIGFAVAIAAGTIRDKRLYRLFAAVNAGFLIIVIMAYSRAPLPETQTQELEKAGITDQDLVVISDYQRPQLAENPAYTFTSISSSGYPAAIETITTALAQHRRVFMTTQAMTFPYRQYDGQMPHILSHGDVYKAHLATFLSDKQLIKVADNPTLPLLSVYQILPEK